MLCSLHLLRDTAFCTCCPDVSAPQGQQSGLPGEVLPQEVKQGALKAVCNAGSAATEYALKRIFEGSESVNKAKL